MVLSDYSAGHSAHPFARHQFYTPHSSSQVSHTLGALDPKTHVVCSSFVLRRPSSVVLSTPSPRRQTSLVFRPHNALSVYCGSFNAQSKVPDISSPSMRASIEELSASSNAQDQAPDDPCHVQDSQCAPRDWFSTSSPFRQALPRLTIWISTDPCQVSFDRLPSAHQIPVRTPTTNLQSFSRKEFHVHSGEVLSSHDEANWISTSDTLARFFRKRHIHHLLFQFGSQRTVLFLPSRTQKHFHQGFWRSEVHVRRLRIKMVSPRVIRVHSAGLCSCLLVRVFFFTDSRGSTLYLFVCILCLRGI